MRDWWKKAFDERYLSFYRPILTPARTEQELRFVLERLQVEPGSRLLDVPCGFGRHSIALAGLGYLMTGLDYSDLMLQKAQQDAKTAGVAVDFRQGDMRELPFADGEFDGAIMLFTSFGYLGRDGDRQAMREIGRVVKPGGRFILDQQNPWPAARDAERRGRQLDDNRYEVSAPLDHHEGIERMVWDAGRHLMTINETWNDAQGTQNFSYQIQAYTVEELGGLLADAGFKFEAVYGDFSGQPHRPFSERMIFVANR